MKPQDSKAGAIQFGVELETFIPADCGISVGGYHRGLPVSLGNSLYGSQIAAPHFAGSYWKAERDGSIRPDPGHNPCEFVSPILHGEEGVAKLGEFVNFIRAIGAKVNASCGCHITVSVDSIIGSSDVQARVEYGRKITHVARWHARAIYGQTGTGRHLIHFSHPLRGKKAGATAKAFGITSWLAAHLPRLDRLDRVDQHDDIEGEIIPYPERTAHFHRNEDYHACPDRKAPCQQKAK